MLVSHLARHDFRIVYIPRASDTETRNGAQVRLPIDPNYAVGQTRIGVCPLPPPSDREAPSRELAFCRMVLALFIEHADDQPPAIGGRAAPSFARSIGQPLMVQSSTVCNSRVRLLSSAWSSPPSRRTSLISDAVGAYDDCGDQLVCVSGTCRPSAGTVRTSRCAATSLGTRPSSAPTDSRPRQG
ncbi:MAG: hypothetical protein JWO36_2376 [Myxococcales bacterium]|nr:hypothetical protein [Myxococcales bacterium]